MAGYTFSDLIERTARYLTPQSEEIITTTSNYTAGSGTLVLDGSSPMLPAVRPGAILAVALNLFYVKSISSNTATVIGGFRGSTDVNSTSGAVVTINPRFSRFDIAQAINDELAALSAPSAGLGQILTTDITYIPVYSGYSLPATFDSASSKVLEVSYKIAPPVRTYPLIRRNQYRVIRNQNPSNTDFPNGCGIIVYGRDGRGYTAYPGLPIHVQYLAPYSPLVNLTDNVLSVAGMPVVAQDIPPMGAMLRLAPDREIGRNTYSAQPDPRKATEVPPGAMLKAADSVSQRYYRRRNEENSRLKLTFPNAEW